MSRTDSHVRQRKKQKEDSFDSDWVDPHDILPSGEQDDATLSLKLMSPRYVQADRARWARIKSILIPTLIVAGIILCIGVSVALWWTGLPLLIPVLAAHAVAAAVVTAAPAAIGLFSAVVSIAAGLWSWFSSNKKSSVSNTMDPISDDIAGPTATVGLGSGDISKRLGVESEPSAKDFMPTDHETGHNDANEVQPLSTSSSVTPLTVVTKHPLSDADDDTCYRP